MDVPRIRSLGFVFVLFAATASFQLAQDPKSVEKPNELTAAQKEKLKERDRLKAEVEKLRKGENWAEAVAAGEKQLAIEREVFGDLHDDVVASFNQLARLHEGREDWPGAKRQRHEVLRIQTKRFGEQDWRTGDARRALADSARMAEMSAEDQRELKRAAGLDAQATLLYRQGKYREAADLCRETLLIDKKVLGPKHPHTATSLNRLGILLWEQGDYAGARRHYEHALDIQKEVLGTEHPHTAGFLINLGLLLQSQGDYARARPLYEQALAIQKKVLGPEHLHIAGSLNNLGKLLWVQGDYAGARPNLEEALAIRRKFLGPEHPDTALSLNNLGTLLESQRDYAGARPLYEQALAIRRKAPGPEHPDTAQSLCNLGVLLTRQRDYVKARPHFEQALAIRKKALGPEHPDTALSLSNLGALLSTDGDYMGARPYLEQALAIRQKALGPEHPGTGLSLSNLGALLDLQEDYAGARPHYEQALAITQNNITLAADGLSERQQLAMAESLRYQLDSCLSAGTYAKIPARHANAPLLQTKGAALARQQWLRLAQQRPELKDTWDAFQSVSSRLAKLSFESPDPKRRDNWRRQLDDSTREKEELEVKLMRESAAFRRQKELQRLTPEQLQKALPVGTALVDFLDYRRFTPPAEGKGRMKSERHLVAFVVRPDQRIIRVDLGLAAPVAAAVEEWRKNYDGAHAAELRRRVWEPVEAHVKDAPIMLISPDGILNQFPFVAMPGKEPGTYLIEERAVAVIPVPQLLPDLIGVEPRNLRFNQEPNADFADDRRQEKQMPSILLVGDVDYDCDPGKPVTLADSRKIGADTRAGPFKGWEGLSGTRTEIATIRDSFEQRFSGNRITVLRQDQATEAALREQGPRHSYLHLATHGFFAPEKMKSALAPAKEERFAAGDLFQHQSVTGWHPGLLSGLVLAGANQKPEPERDDGILTAIEVAPLDLSGVDLAVLSACETGLGEVAGGEGLLGLQRAFQTAGARSVVAGLWKVNDKATQMLMTRFYENLWGKKLSKLEALREAQIWMLREVPKQDALVRGLAERGLGDEDRPVPKKDQPLPPYYWAGFVLSVDCR